jgi:hypothetical protein
MKTHPAVEGLLKLGERTGVLLLEREDALLALFHLEGGRLLKATGLTAIVPEASPKDPRDLLRIELDRLKRVEREKGWYAAWVLVAEQLSLSLFALRSIPGKKRLRFVSEAPPEEVRRYGAGYPLREDILRLFFAEGRRSDGGEEWEDFTSW